jgi:hypothetical protein
MRLDAPARTAPVTFDSDGARFLNGPSGLGRLLHVVDIEVGQFSYRIKQAAKPAL